MEDIHLLEWNWTQIPQLMFHSQIVCMKKKIVVIGRYHLTKDGQYQVPWQILAVNKFSEKFKPVTQLYYKNKNKNKR